MFRFLYSIRNKIKVGFYFLFATMVAFSVFTLAELNLMITKIRYSETISDYYDNVLEVRRFEKNFFLYKKDNDLAEAHRFLKLANDNLIENSDYFLSIINLQSYNELLEYIDEYNKLLLSLKTKDYENINAEIEEKFELKIRELGKNILNVSEEILKKERLNFQLKLSGYQEILIIAVIVIWLVTIIMSQLLSKMIVEPLKLLQSSMELISAGKFTKIQIKSDDIEIISLTNAVNKMLDEIDKKQKYLIQSEKLASLGTLVAGVMHEINNPLSNISSSAQILREEIEDDDLEFKKELLSQIDDQCERAKNIVKSLLEFSRKSDFKKTSINLKKMLNETYIFIKGEIPPQITFDIEVCETLFIIGDKQRLQQAFLNLIKNSIEAIGKNEGYIFITAYRTDNDNVLIEFSDNGHGISNDLISRVFDPFFTTKDVGKGSGLGLFIVYEIITEHNGTISVKSEQGIGAVFFIKLPEFLESPLNFNKKVC